MPIICREITDFIEEKYPIELAENFDNVGLLIGSYEKEVSRVLVCLEITEEVVQEAIRMNIDMIVAHHPIIFNGLKRITDRDYIPSLVIKLIKADINVYAMHTNFDNAVNGMNDILTDIIGLEEVETLSGNKNTKLFKIVTFIPEGHIDAVQNAMLDAGAGHIGNYSHCSFSSQGTGTFKPLNGTNPFIGEEGKLEIVKEMKLETIVKDRDIKRVLDAMIKSHPYEEIAYDIYHLNNELRNGTGRVGYLREPIEFKSFCMQIKEKLNLNMVIAIGEMDKIVRKVAVVGGSGDDFIEDCIRSKCDVLITGDIKHHIALDARAAKLNIIDAGHYNTEVVSIPYISQMLQANLDISCFISKVNTNPFNSI